MPMLSSEMCTLYAVARAARESRRKTCAELHSYHVLRCIPLDYCGVLALVVKNIIKNVCFDWFLRYLS
jgi:hypothetical protein